jgi:hypothetical protein
MSRGEPDLAGVRAAAERVFAALDWDALGELYFHFGGAGFWRERRAKVLACGEVLARALLRRVPRGGRSLWVGAGVAELPVLLAETALHERHVVPANLRARECDVLNAGLRAAGLPEVYVAGDAADVAAALQFDHVGCISVFTDPETWPLLSDVAYGRIAPVQVDVERFVAEREEARRFAQRIVVRLQRPGVVTTSAEEVSWFLEQAVAIGARCDADDELIETAVVGDPVGFLEVR